MTPDILNKKQTGEKKKRKNKRKNKNKKKTLDPEIDVCINVFHTQIRGEKV